MVGFPGITLTITRPVHHLPFAEAENRLLTLHQNLVWRQSRFG